MFEVVEIAIQVARQLVQRLGIDLALELDHGIQRDPVLVPAPGVEFGMIARAQRHVAVARDQAQQEPDLLLAPVAAAPFTPDPLCRHFVTQPVSGAAKDPDMVGLQPHLFLKLPEHCLLRGFTVLDSALRKLPGMLLDALAPEYLVPCSFRKAESSTVR